MLSEKLKELTQENHLLLERKLVTAMKSVKEIREYASLLAVFYSFFGGLEQGIAKFMGQADLFNYEQRRKASAIAADLLNLGYSLPELATESSLPALRNKFQALGCLYVIEGSTLGGRTIRKMLETRLPEPALKSFSFFEGYGNQTMPMWLQFKSTLDHSISPLKRNQELMIIQAANETFLKFSAWFDVQNTERFTG